MMPRFGLTASIPTPSAMKQAAVLTAIPMNGDIRYNPVASYAWPRKARNDVKSRTRAWLERAIRTPVSGAGETAMPSLKKKVQSGVGRHPVRDGRIPAGHRQLGGKRSRSTAVSLPAVYPKNLSRPIRATVAAHKNAVRLIPARRGAPETFRSGEPQAGRRQDEGDSRQWVHGYRVGKYAFQELDVESPAGQNKQAHRKLTTTLAALGSLITEDAKAGCPGPFPGFQPVLKRDPFSCLQGGFRIFAVWKAGQTVNLIKYIRKPS